MDGGSHDGTVEWLTTQPSLISRVQRDRGMYEAVNRGLRLARGAILAHLDWNEQYLPGSLRFVKRCFVEHPHVDLPFGEILTVPRSGDLIAYRKTIRPLVPVLSLPPLYVSTAATFFRRRIVDDGILYDDSFKDIADLAWITRLRQRGYRLQHVRRYLASSTMT